MSKEGTACLEAVLGGFWSVSQEGKRSCQSVCLKIVSEITDLAHFFAEKGYKHSFSEKATKKSRLL